MCFVDTMYQYVAKRCSLNIIPVIFGFHGTGRRRRCQQKTLYSEDVSYRRCIIQRMYPAEDVSCRGCILQKMYHAEYIACRRRCMQRLYGLNISSNSELLIFPIQFSPVATVISARSRFFLIISLIFSSNVLLQINRCTITFLCCPIR